MLSMRRLLDLHGTAGNAAVAALVQGADTRAAQSGLTGSGPSELGDALAETFGENAREVPIETESAVARRAEGVTVDGRVHLGPGRLDATSHEGQVRIGHEVAHALQQARGANTTSGRSPVTRTRRANLEAEAERAGQAFAGGRPFAVSGVAPAGTALFRGGDEQEPEAERELDAAIAELDAKWAARDATLAAARKERQDWLRAHAEWREFDVPVDEVLRKAPTSLQPHELDVRLLETALGSISREDAEYVLRRMAWTSRSVEQDPLQEQIRTREKIHYRTRDISLAVEYYNQLIEDRQRRWAYIDELLHTGPDMALEMLKDTGRGVYNGSVGFVQGVADLPLAPVNLIRTIQGKEQKHLIDLGDLRAGYHTSYGVHQGSSIELGTQLGLTAVTGKLPGGWAAGSSATVTQTSRAAGLLSAWWKVNSLVAGGTAVVQAGQAIRDIARGYVVENGKQRPLTEDDIIQRLGGIAFGAHVAYHAIGGRPGRPSTAAGAEPPAATASPELLIDRPTTSTIRVRSPGETGSLLIDDSGWRVVANDGTVVAQGSPDEGRLLASRLTGSDVSAAEPGAAPEPSRPPASPPTELLEPPKAPAVAEKATDVSPLELPGEEVIIEGRAPERPITTPRPEPAAPEPTPENQPPAPSPEPAVTEEAAQNRQQDQPVSDAETAPPAASRKGRKPSARSVRREAARGRLQEILTRVNGEIEEAGATETRTRKTVTDLKGRIKTLAAERDAAEGDARAALDTQIEQTKGELVKTDGGGYQDELTGATRRVYDLRQYAKKVKAALTLKRPGLRAATKRDIRALCSKQQLPDGRWIDANTRKVITDAVVFGHKAGFEHWRLAIQAIEQGMTQSQFDAWVNENPEWFQIESKAENESHAHENHED